MITVRETPDVVEVEVSGRLTGDEDRIAVVGEKWWEEWATRASQPFLKANRRFFRREEADDARRWVSEGGPNQDGAPNP